MASDVFNLPCKPLTKAELKALEPLWGEAFRLREPPAACQFLTFAGAMNPSDNLYHGVLRFRLLTPSEQEKIKTPRDSAQLPLLEI